MQGRQIVFIETRIRNGDQGSTVPFANVAFESTAPLHVVSYVDSATKTFTAAQPCAVDRAARSLLGLAKIGLAHTAHHLQVQRSIKQRKCKTCTSNRILANSTWLLAPRGLGAKPSSATPHLRSVAIKRVHARARFRRSKYSQALR